MDIAGSLAGIAALAHVGLRAGANRLALVTTVLLALVALGRGITARSAFPPPPRRRACFRRRHGPGPVVAVLPARSATTVAPLPTSPPPPRPAPGSPSSIERRQRVLPARSTVVAGPDFEQVLIIGAGSGNDVAPRLRSDRAASMRSNRPGHRASARRPSRSARTTTRGSASTSTTAEPSCDEPPKVRPDRVRADGLAHAVTPARPTSGSSRSCSPRSRLLRRDHLPRTECSSCTTTIASLARCQAPGDGRRVHSARAAAVAPRDDGACAAVVVV